MGKTEGWVAKMAWTGGLGLLLTVLTGGIWTALLLANLATTPAIPWALAATAIVIWSLWSPLGGNWWPDPTQDTRRRYLRDRRDVPCGPFFWAIFPGRFTTVSPPV
jgi:hypothetical protein